MVCTFNIVPSPGPLARPYVAEESFFITMRISRNSPLVAPITGTALKQLKFSLTKIHPQQVLCRMCQHTPQVYDLKIKLICSPTLKVLITKSSQVYLHTIVFKASPSCPGGKKSRHPGRHKLCTYGVRSCRIGGHAVDF